VCHSSLARGRPDAAHLTEFYLWLSVGGVLGGSLTALLAPVVFDGVAEYPLGLLAAALLGLAPATDTRGRARLLDLLAPPVLGALAVGLALGVRLLPGEPLPSVTLLAFGIPSFLAFLLSARRLRFVLALGAILLAGRYAPAGGAITLLAERSFFGVHRVTRDAEGRHHLLLHGRIVHGMQRLDPTGRAHPLSYYHRGGPLGQVFAALAPGPGAIGVVGLGAGAIAAYGQRGDRLVFYEIDPVVARIAQDRRYFHYLADSAAKVEVVLGDARLSLQHAADGAFRLLVLDAYSSDSIQIHLLTQEALRLYLEKLAPGGWLAFHISNLHLNLRPVLETLAHDAGLAGAVRDDAGLTDAELADGKSASQWLVLARREAEIEALLKDGGWERLRAQPGRRPWTDDYSSLLEALAPGNQ
jgi:SAM-dependent methyltransferase